MNKLQIANVLGAKPEEFFGPIRGEIICSRATVHVGELSDFGALQVMAMGVVHPECKEVHAVALFGVN